MKNVDDDIFNVINDMHEKSILNESTFIKYVERIILISIWWSWNLYPALSFLVKLMHIKVPNCQSNKLFDILLELLLDDFPKKKQTFQNHIMMWRCCKIWV